MQLLAQTTDSVSTWYQTQLDQLVLQKEVQ